MFKEPQADDNLKDLHQDYVVDAVKHTKHIKLCVGVCVFQSVAFGSNKMTLSDMPTSHE